MRFTLPKSLAASVSLLVTLGFLTPAQAQTPPVAAAPAAPTAPAATTPNPTPVPVVPDWKSYGKGLPDDSKSMLDRYVYLNDQTVDKNINVNEAVISHDGVIKWVRERVSQVLTIGGRTYDREIYNNRFLFTPSGYADYVIYLKNSNIGVFLKNNQYKLATIVESLPNITSEQVKDSTGTGIYTWQVTAPLIMSYLDYKNEPPAALFKGKLPREIDNRIPLIANIELVRIPVQSNGNMIAINHISFAAAPAVKKPASAESLDQTDDDL